MCVDYKNFIQCLSCGNYKGAPLHNLYCKYRTDGGSCHREINKNKTIQQCDKCRSNAKISIFASK